MKIKPIIAEIGVAEPPQVRAPANIGTGFSRGLFQVGESLERVSGDLERTARTRQAIKEKQQAYTDLFDAANLHAAAKQEIAKHSEKWETTDYGKVMEEAENNLQGLKENLLGRAKTEGMSPAAVKHFERDWIQVQGQALLDARKIDDRKFKEKSRADLSDLLEMGVEESIPMGKDGRASHFKNIDNLVDHMMNDGIISGLEAANYKKGLRTNSETKTKAIMEEIRKQEEKEKETEVYSYLKEKHGDDYDAMLKELQNPAFLKTAGMTIEKAANLSGILRNQNVKEDTARQERYRQTERSMFGLLQKNELSLEMINEAVELDRWEPKTAEHYKKQIESEIKDSKTADPETDFEVYANLRKEILNATTPAERDAAQKRLFSKMSSLSKKDREKLIDLNLGEEDRGVTEDRKYGRGVLNSELLPNAEGMFTSKQPEDYRNFYDAEERINQEIDAAIKAGKPLKRSEIKQRALEIAKTYALTVAQQFEREQKMIKEVGEAIKTVKDKGKGSQKPEPSKYEKTATNPQTGERQGYRNGKWETIK